MSTQVKVGDYIEGYEIIGVTGYKSIHKTRVIVQSIHDYDSHVSYYGQADDGYYGARATSIDSSIGNITVIVNEKPFESRWWEKTKTRSYSLAREWQPGDIVRKYDNTLYKIINIGINSETYEQVIIYQELTHENKIYSEPRELFESINNENDEQTWRFELVSGGNNGCKSTSDVE